MAVFGPPCLDGFKATVIPFQRKAEVVNPVIGEYQAQVAVDEDIGQFSSRYRVLNRIFQRPKFRRFL